MGSKAESLSKEDERPLDSRLTAPSVSLLAFPVVALPLDSRLPTTAPSNSLRASPSVSPFNSLLAFPLESLLTSPFDSLLASFEFRLEVPFTSVLASFEFLLASFEFRLTSPLESLLPLAVDP